MCERPYWQLYDFYEHLQGQIHPIRHSKRLIYLCFQAVSIESKLINYVLSVDPLKEERKALRKGLQMPFVGETWSHVA